MLLVGSTVASCLSEATDRFSRSSPSRIIKSSSGLWIPASSGFGFATFAFPRLVMDSLGSAKSFVSPTGTCEPEVEPRFLGISENDSMEPDTTLPIRD